MQGITKQQRSVRKSKGLGWVLLAALVLIVVLALTGCAASLDKSVSTCAALDGSWEYTRAEGLEKFSCQRPAAPAQTRTVAR